MNGIDTAKLGGLAEALKGNPGAGRVRFGTKSRWQDGARIFTTVEGFGVDGRPLHAGSRRFVLLSDEPTELSGTDAAAGPAEQLMHAMASCIAATINANAAMSGVRLTALEIALEGDIDLHGILGLDDKVRPGFPELRAAVAIAGEADEATLRDIAKRGIGSSPIRDSVERGVRVQSEIAARRTS